MKRRFWIGGVLLLMIFTGMTGCGGPKEPLPEHMLDGPDMMYTPEDQTPYAGTWQSRDGTIVMKVERGGGAESKSDMSLSVNGEPEFEAKLWVYSTGHVELLRGKEKVTISGTFCNLRFSTSENAFYGYLGAELVIPASVLSLKSGCFYTCTSKITFDERSSIRTVGENAFSNFGAIYYEGANSELIVEKCYFVRNEATTNRGGAITIFAHGGELRVVDSVFSANRSYAAGAIHCSGADVTIQSSRFEKNRSKYKPC